MRCNGTIFMKIMNDYLECTYIESKTVSVHKLLLQIQNFKVYNFALSELKKILSQ